MVKKLVLRPNIGDLMAGVKRYGGQGIGRPLSSLVVQTPYAAPDGESEIPSLHVVQAMSELEDRLTTAANELATAQTAIEAADELIEKNRLLAEQKFSELENTIGSIEVGGGQYTISEVDPTADDGAGKPTNAVWEVRSGAEALRRFVWNGTVWLTYEAGADFIAADKVAAAVGVFIDAMMENLSVTGVAALTSVTTNALWAKLAVVERLQVLESIITRDMVATGAITGDKMTVDSAFVSKLTAQNAWFGDVTAKKMVASEIIASTITGSVFTTAAPGAAARTYIDTGGLTVYAGGADRVKIGHGIPTGMAIRSPGGQMIPIGDGVFGTKTQVVPKGFSKPLAPGGSLIGVKNGDSGVTLPSVTVVPWTSNVIVRFGALAYVNNCTMIVKVDARLYVNGTAASVKDFGNVNNVNYGMGRSTVHDGDWDVEFGNTCVFPVTPGSSYTFTFRISASTVTGVGSAGWLDLLQSFITVEPANI